MATRWVRPEPDYVFELTALWPGMTQPIVFRVDQYRVMHGPDGYLEVSSGDRTPYVAVIPSGLPAFLAARQVLAEPNQVAHGYASTAGVLP